MLVKIDRKEALEMLVQKKLSKRLYVKKNEDYYRAERFNWRFKNSIWDIGEALSKITRSDVDFNMPIYFYGAEFYKEIDIEATQKEEQKCE